MEAYGRDDYPYEGHPRSSLDQLQRDRERALGQY